LLYRTGAAVSFFSSRTNRGWSARSRRLEMNRSSSCDASRETPPSSCRSQACN